MTEFKLREDFQFAPPTAVAPDPKHCEKNEKSHRHLPANLVSDRESGCRFCGQPIERAHVKSTWWSLSTKVRKPSKAQLRAGKKMLRKAFARKDQVGSTRADAKRKALEFVERKTGKKLSWKAARKQLKRLAHAEKGLA